MNDTETEVNNGTANAAALNETPQPTDENGNDILPPKDGEPGGEPIGEAGLGTLNDGAAKSDIEAEKVVVGNTAPEAQPVPQDDGGATLAPTATASPVLVASIEVYLTGEGMLLTNFTAGQHTYPQHSTDDLSETIGFIDGLLKEKVA